MLPEEGTVEGVVLEGGMVEGVVLEGGMMEGEVPLEWKLERICCTSFSQSFYDYRVAASFPSLQL